MFTDINLIGGKIFIKGVVKLKGVIIYVLEYTINMFLCPLNPYIRMETDDRVVIVLLDLLLTDGTLPHADADARMMSQEILMVLSVALMQLLPLLHEMNEINPSWVPGFLATLLVLCTNLFALFQNQERKTVSIYANTV
jgi:hypothetical protein